MSIESEFYHRGFPVRLKYRPLANLYHIFILTDQGPHFDTAKSIFEAKRKAVSLINDWTSGDWTLARAVQCTTGDGDVLGRLSEICRAEASKATASTTRRA